MSIERLVGHLEGRIEQRVAMLAIPPLAGRMPARVSGAVRLEIPRWHRNWEF
jgi:ABC-type molybdate transport system ATPase subunit